MKLKGKLLTALLAVVAVTIVGSMFSGLQLGELHRAGRTIGANGAPELAAIKDMQVAALRAQVAFGRLLGGLGDAETAEAMLTRFEEARSQAQALLSGEVAAETSHFAEGNRTERSELENAVRHLRLMDDLTQQLVRQYEAEGTIPGVLVDRVDSQFRQFNDIMRSLVSGVQSRMSQQTENLQTTYENAILYMSLTMASALAAALCISLVFASRLAGRVRRMVQATEAAAAGDFTEEVKSEGKDELSQMGAAVNSLAESLSGMIADVREVGQRVADASVDLATNAEETASAANQISANAESIRKQSENQSRSVQDVSKSIDTISESVSSLSERIEYQSSSVSESSSSIEEMVASIQSVTANVERTKSHLAELVQSASDGHEVLDSANNQVQEIAEKSESMLEANRVIAGIASQTNLLAMNAAIEAAHAGQYGQGFAVVADEIRQLAENASQQSTEVDELLRSLKSSIDTVAESSQRSLDAFVSVREGITQVDELEGEIESSMQEQSAGSSQVLEALNRINTITEEVRSSAESMRSNSDSVRDEMNNLVQTSEEVRQSIAEIANGTDEINRSVAHISEIGTTNRELVGRLEDSLTQFRLREGGERHEPAAAAPPTGSTAA